MNKSTLIILPGWGGSHETWEDFVELAKPHFQDVIVIDLPCFGNEPCPTEVWGVEEYANFVKKRITSSPHHRIVLLGHSFGGAVAIHLVAYNPELVETLILSGAAVYRPKKYLKRALFVMLAKIGKRFVLLLPSSRLHDRAKRVLYKVAGSPDFDNTRGTERAIFKKNVRQDQRHLLSTISIPTCVIHGTADRYVPFRFGKRTADHIPFASFVAVDHGGHGLHQQRTQELLGAILTYIQKTT